MSAILAGGIAIAAHPIERIAQKHGDRFVGKCISRIINACVVLSWIE
jgi:hypothetical protein